MTKRKTSYRYFVFRPSLFAGQCIVRRDTFLTCATLLIFVINVTSLRAQGKLTIHFNHLANDRKIIARTGLYRNSFNEPYSITKFKYYVSNFSLKKKLNGIFLIDAFGSDSLQMPIPAGNYNGISFLLGVDSIHNVAGAQSGALDPLNDMFWTWNSGYVTWKLEGFSDSSHADLQRIEQHIGGYRHPYNTSHSVYLSFPQPLVITKQHNSADITINCFLDEYWSSIVTNKISEQPVIVAPGIKATNLSQNFGKLFKIANIRNK